jgi:predicted nucleic acid-binding protein
LGYFQIDEVRTPLKNYVVLPYDYQLCLKWAETRCSCEKKGFTIEQADCWIAASALRHDCAFDLTSENSYTMN